MADWQRRTFWAVVVGFVLLIVVTAAEAIAARNLRDEVSQRDAYIKKRLDALELDVSLLKRAKLGQDDFNQILIKELEQSAQARSPHRGIQPRGK